MKCTLSIFEGDVFNEETEAVVLQGDDLIALLQSHWQTFPETARLYFQEVSLATDITPSSEHDIEALRKMEGNFVVVVYPGAAIPLMVWAAIAVVAVVVIAAFVLKPKIPNVAARNVQSSSPNNALSDRSNQARPKARIPDIYGTVRAYPDLIQSPYKYFIDGKEVESSLLCIGRGFFEIHNVKESDTDMSQIVGSAVSIWDPELDLVSDTPTYEFGATSHAPNHIWDNFGLCIVKRSNSVDGQTLAAPNSAGYNGSGSTTFYPDGRIVITPLQGVDLNLETRFAAGDNLTLSNATIGVYSRSCDARPDRATDTFILSMLQSLFDPDPKAGDSFYIDPAVVGSQNLSGQYVIESAVRENSLMYIKLVNPAAVNSNWNLLPDVAHTIRTTAYWGDIDNSYSLNGNYEVVSVLNNVIEVEPTAVWSNIPAEGSPTVNAYLVVQDAEASEGGGPFNIVGRNVRCLMLNFYAQQGLYRDDGRNQQLAVVQVEARVQPLTSTGQPIGSVIVALATITGSDTETDPIGHTLYIDVPEAASYSITATRLTPKDTDFDGRVVDEIKWRDLYSVAVTDKTSFGNVTVVRATVRATETALAVRERKLNCLVTRKIPLRVAGDQFTDILHPTNRIDEIFAEICRDPYIGNRPPYEIDYEQIYAKVAEAELYFGFKEAVEFCYTIDSDNLTFEDIAQMVAGAGLLTAYRQGHLVRFEFERRDPPSRLLFNHRNKVPGSEQRSYQFARENNYDGVEFTYIDPYDDAQQTLYVPNDGALNPKKVESVGIRNANQAHIHAWREWNKIRYRHTIIQIEGLAESETVIPPQCVLIADNTKSSTADGQVTAVNGLVLGLSQEAYLEAGKSYAINLQMSSGLVETVAIQPVASSGWFNSVVLSTPPSQPIIFDEDYVAPTVYDILEQNDSDIEKFILTEREGGGSDDNVYPITAINYDGRYYANDQDFAASEEEQWLKSLGDLVLWLDSRALDTIFEQNGKIHRWADRSDYSNDGTQNIEAFRPDVDSIDFSPRSVGFDDNIS